jgi:hypothetical protein
LAAARTISMASRTARTILGDLVRCMASRFPSPAPMATMARPLLISLRESRALAILRGCISKGLTASAPTFSRLVAMATGTRLMKGSQWAK